MVDSYIIVTVISRGKFIALLFFQKSRFKDPELIKRQHMIEPIEEQTNNQEHLFKARLPKSLGHVVSQSQSVFLCAFQCTITHELHEAHERLKL